MMKVNDVVLYEEGVAIIEDEQGKFLWTRDNQPLTPLRDNAIIRIVNNQVERDRMLT
jgi:hypothetical protein